MQTNLPAKAKVVNNIWPVVSVSESKEERITKITSANILNHFFYRDFHW